ncbi:DUF6870 family protein [Otoolea muris]|uniref:DUF6870 family protein n=1 Tax=Otoolea muris TaxID=2941515 RepID=UPI0020410C4E|nr:hypothetical protein [Otoolea muris]
MKKNASMEAPSLVDIREVSVDKTLTREERIAEFVRQIKNPYCFKCGRFTVRVQFAENGASLEDCLKRILI